MRNIILITTLLWIIAASCKQKSSIDLSELDQHVNFTDSLNLLLDTKYQNVMDGIYSLIDDTAMADSLSRVVVLPVNQMFYPYLQSTLATSEEMYYYSLQEIFFTKDQLNELKEDVIKNQISKVQYEIQLNANMEMFKVLKERVDSSINYFDSVSELLYLNVTDSLK